MAGIFKIICTPIGNLGDLTLRVKKELNQSQIIIAEDAVKVLHLLKYLNIDYGILSDIYKAYEEMYNEGYNVYLGKEVKNDTII